MDPEVIYFVYAIESIIDNYIYVGLTENVNRRIEQHNNGWNKTTRSYRPFKILLIERYSTRLEARKREKYLKSGTGKEFLKLKRRSK